MTDKVNSVRDYLREIGRFPLLKPDEEIRLGKAVQKMLKCQEAKEEIDRSHPDITQEEWVGKVGCSKSELLKILDEGKRAKDRMVEANLRLVIAVAKKYQHRGLELADLIQEGGLGLIRAVEKFDPTKGYKFSTYAYWWIRQALLKAIEEKSRAIRFPNHLHEKLSNLKKVRNELIQIKSRNPTINELAQALDTSLENILSLLKLSRPISSLDALVGEDEKECLGNIIPDPKQDLLATLEFFQAQEIVAQLLAEFPVKQRTVIERRYSQEEPTFREIGKELNLNRERVRQIHDEVLKKLIKKVSYPPTLAISPLSFSEKFS